MISFRHIEWAADIRLHFGSSFFLQQEPTSTEGQRSIERAMSQIVASLEACGRYLETMKTFPSFMQAKESQLSSLTCQFGRHSWSLSEGSEALELLQRQAIWNETERSSLALAIQNGLSARAAATSRQTMQDYTNVILYLPKSIWEQLMNADLTFQAKANLLGVFATTLGMKTPSEATSQMMTALLLACPGGRELELKCSLSPVQLHELFLLVKKELRSSVAAAGTSDALPHVEKLPTNPAQMDPRWLQRALGAEPVGQCPLNLSQVAARAVTIPMRNTNRQLHDVTKGKGRQQMQKLRSLASSSPALLTLLPGLQDVDEGELEIPGFSMVCSAWQDPAGGTSYFSFGSAAAAFRATSPPHAADVPGNSGHVGVVGSCCDTPRGNFGWCCVCSCATGRAMERSQGGGEDGGQRAAGTSRRGIRSGENDQEGGEEAYSEGQEGIQATEISKGHEREREKHRKEVSGSKDQGDEKSSRSVEGRL